MANFNRIQLKIEQFRLLFLATHTQIHILMIHVNLFFISFFGVLLFVANLCGKNNRCSTVVHHQANQVRQHHE